MLHKQIFAEDFGGRPGRVQFERETTLYLTGSCERIVSVAVDPVTGQLVPAEAQVVDPVTGHVVTQQVMIGPDGQQVMVGPDGQQMVVGPDGQYLPAQQQVSEDPGCGFGGGFASQDIFTGKISC